MTDSRRELARLPVSTMQDVLIARFVGREQAVRMGFQPAAVVAVATAVSEIARNVVQHARAPGWVAFSELTSADRRGIEITVEDGGVGMSRANDLLEGVGLPPGAGLPGSRKLMDEMAVVSRPGLTRVEMRKWAVRKICE